MKPKLGALVLVTGLVAATAACSSHVGSTKPADAGGASAAPDLAYYNGKTITYDVPAAPGTSSYISAQILAPVAGAFLHATINLVSVPAGNGIAGQNEVNASRADGLTLGTLNTNTDLQAVITQQQGTNFDVTKTTIIAGELRSPSLIVSAPSSPFKTLEDAINSPTQFTVIDDSGGSDEQLRVIFGAYQAKAHILSGYADAGSVVQGFLRGDGPVTQQSLADLQGALEGGKATPLVLNAPITSTTTDYKLLQTTPAIGDFVKAHQPPTANGQKAMDALVAQFTNDSPNQVVFAAPGTPSAYAGALQQAFQHALTDPTVQQKFTAAGLTPGFVSPADTLTHMTDVINGAPAIRTYLKYSYAG
jgi:tripartite-type tricarboxylate transporter receptor subunit TctC